MGKRFDRFWPQLISFDNLYLAYRAPPHPSDPRPQAPSDLGGAPVFGNRVVHHALVNVIEPLFERRFIYDTYANRRRKGVAFPGAGAVYCETTPAGAIDRRQFDVRMQGWVAHACARRHLGLRRAILSSRRVLTARRSMNDSPIFVAGGRGLRVGVATSRPERSTLRANTEPALPPS